jgi:hypothetical protein
LFEGWSWGEQVEHKVLVEFEVAHSDGDCLVELVAYFTVDLADSSRNNATILEVSGTATHSECFA